MKRWIASMAFLSASLLLTACSAKLHVDAPVDGSFDETWEEA